MTDKALFKKIAEKKARVDALRPFDDAHLANQRAFDYMFSLLRESGIKMSDIFELHRLFYVGIDESRAEKLPLEMDKLEKWVNNNAKLCPVVFAAELHRRLVTIHPFIDGNGRTARLAMKGGS